MNEIAIVDVTLRDGHQSLWAERMTTGMMLPIAEQLGRAGFAAIELLSPSHLGKCVVELREDPFERVRMVARRIRNTPLRLNAGGLNLFGVDQPAMYQLFWNLMAKTAYGRRASPIRGTIRRSGERARRPRETPVSRRSST